MVCGATLKQPREFELGLWSPASPKWRCCTPLPSPTPGQAPRTQRCHRFSRADPTTDSAAPHPAPQQSCLPTLEQTFQNIKQEYSPYQRWRHLEAVLNQSETCTSESQPHSSALTAPSSPGSSGMKKDQRSSPLRQVRIICEHLLKDYEEKIPEEYEQILNTKLAKQYEPLVKCPHDQIM
ncbi:akirin-1-like isoform X1 [Neomonachus schauinslandi]|uniref:Akirin-1-like isoform X1 n=1 Tax=Neomonachus schauinslandi TaxID=29088 RepID=A0A8M1MAQ3_NEOSC|nr:akirin-1-like isoform X1 [Neomonachus schauinslandi]